MNKEKLLSKVFPDIQADYTHRDTILYALGVGAAILLLRTGASRPMAH